MAIATRLATTADLPFLDGLQKQHSKALGFFPRAQMQGYVANQWVLVAEDAATKQPLGYCASRDRYLKRDELGVVYQLCVVPGDQRKLIGAALMKSVFDRSAYGCRLYCCWCAQDLPANHFWESMGFVPIAFRAGSTGKRRVHIFWQRRINDRDVSTPYWYPSMTNQGAIREDRLVFPIPPGTHWTEVQAVALPSTTASSATPALTAPAGEAKTRRATKAQRAAQPPASRPRAVRQYGPPSAGPIVEETPKPAAVIAAKEKPPREKKSKVKVDPQLVSKARELRDRYLEHLAANPEAALLPAHGKYDVSRALAGGASALKQLPVSEAA